MKLHRPASILLNAVAVFCLCSLSPQGYAIPSAAAVSNDELVWFANLVKTNNGKTFCASLDTTAGDFADALPRYSEAHPELKGQVTDKQTIQALAESFPCKAHLSPAAKNSPNPDAGTAR